MLTVSASDVTGAGTDGKSKITVNETLGAGNKFVYKNFGAASVQVPNVGDSLADYTDLPGDGIIEATHGDNIAIAEVDTNGKVVKFGQTTADEPVTEEPEEPSHGLTVTASDPTGPGTNGKTKIAVAETPGAGNKLVYKNYLTFTPILPTVGTKLVGYDDLPADGIIEAADGDNIIVAELDSEGIVVRVGVGQAVVVNEQAPRPPSNNPPSQPAAPAQPAAPEPASGVDVLVNGKVENAGTATTAEVNGRQVTTVALDQEKLENKLASEGRGAVVTVPVNAESDVVIGELNGRMVKNMENNGAVLVIQTATASYTLPAQQINIDALSGQIGKAVELQDIKVQIEIAEPAAETVQMVESAAADGSFELVVPPLEFTVRAVHEDTVVEVAKFTAYVERMVAIPDGVDPEKITTAIVVDPDGTVRHVLTRVELIDGRYYAKINSLTNSTYTVIWHPVEFADVTNHWAKDAVNDMGSRMVIDGTGNGRFDPDQDITRAEFAAILVRALGLKPEEGAAPFADVRSPDWHSGAIYTASEYGLIEGYTDGTFRPHEKITREQAMTILARAMAITGLKRELPPYDPLAVFADASDVSAWARSGVADSLLGGLVTGKDGGKLAPQDHITRAEAAAVIQRLLRNSDLI